MWQKCPVTYIYGLICPLSNTIRYIGKSDSPRDRYKAHLFRSGGTSHKEQWLAKLQKLGKKPKLVILKVVDAQCCAQAEIDTINHYRNLGNDLTNTTEGGIAPKVAGDTIAKAVARRKANDSYGHSDEWKKTMSKNNSGVGNPFYGRVHTAKTKAIIGEKSKGRCAKPLAEITGQGVVIYESMGEVCSLLEVDNSTVSRASTKEKPIKGRIFYRYSPIQFWVKCPTCDAKLVECATCNNRGIIRNPETV